MFFLDLPRLLHPAPESYCMSTSEYVHAGSAVSIVSVTVNVWDDQATCWKVACAVVCPWSSVSCSFVEPCLDAIIFRLFGLWSYSRSRQRVCMLTASREYCAMTRAFKPIAFRSRWLMTMRIWWGGRGECSSDMWIFKSSKHAVDRSKPIETLWTTRRELPSGKLT